MPTTSASPAHAEHGFPEDLQAALGQARLQYKATELSAVEDVRRDGDLLRLVPTPAANESWAIGGKLVFSSRTGDESITGEVVEYSPDDGSIFVDVPDFGDPHRFQVRYVPFDYSAALLGAFERLREHPFLLQTAVAGVCGVSPGEVEGPLLLPAAETAAVAQAWSRPWAVLWGPPGTGKTQSVASALADYASHPGVGKVLVVAPTNLAADELAYRTCSLLAERKVAVSAVYRGGRGAGTRLSERFPDCLRDAAYAEIYDGTKREIAGLEREQAAARRKNQSAKAAEIQKKINALRENLPDETTFVVTSGKARVVVLTTFKALRFVGQGDYPRLFTKVILDEAGMISRVTAAAVATLGQSVLLAGDPKQIGPVFASPRGLSKDVRKWVMESALGHLSSPRAIPRGGAVRFLDTQYRMHPDISAAVGAFSYDGLLRDSGQAKALASEEPRVPAFPRRRAACLLLDDAAPRPEDACARRPKRGTGYERPLSARIAFTLAQAAAAKGSGVLVLSPYRAQVAALRRLLKEVDRPLEIAVGTIHRNQGTERDVVVVDLVRAALSWSDAEIATLLNVALSRAKRHFILIASRAELSSPVLRRLAAHLSLERLPREILEGEGVQLSLDFGTPPSAVDAPTSRAPARPGTLGEEIRILDERLPLFTADQARLCDRNLGEGHYLVRGVAGSGKTAILAHWAARMVQRHPARSVLVTFFNKGMLQLLRSMVRAACDRLGVSDAPITIRHVSRVDQDHAYDAVFVDEAQDMEAQDLRKLYDLCLPHPAEEGRRLRNLILFSDDSQNVYGRQPLDELRQQLPEEFAFTGRSFVLRESHRSTRAILSFAVNLALDPKKAMSVEEPGLLRFMKVAELAKEGLLERPEESPDGLYHVRYTERPGVAPIVIQGRSAPDVLHGVAREIKRLLKDEDVRPGDIMVVAPKLPVHIKKALDQAGIPAVAYAGKSGANPSGMPARDASHVRCTTIFTCKGHEAPVVFFANVQDVDSAENFIQDRSADELRKMKRCMLYVGSSRAMIRLYVAGTDCPSLRAAREYCTAEVGSPGLL